MTRDGLSLDLMTLETYEDVKFWTGRANKCGSAILEEMSKRMKIQFDIQYTESLSRLNGELKR